MPEKSVTFPGRVAKIIPSSTDEPEKAQVKVEKADHLYDELRIENDLHLQPGAPVDVTIEKK